MPDRLVKREGRNGWGEKSSRRKTNTKSSGSEGNGSSEFHSLSAWEILRISSSSPPGERGRSLGIKRSLLPLSGKRDLRCHRKGGKGSDRKREGRRE